MLRCVVLIAFLLTGLGVSSQHPVDSLSQQLALHDDSGKVHIYNKIAKQYIQTDSAQVFENTEKAIRLTGKRNWDNELGTAFFLRGDACYYASSYDNAIANYQKSNDHYLVAGDTLGLIEVANSIGLSYYYLQQFEQSAHHFFEGLRMAEKIENREQIAFLLANMGMVHISMMNLRAAINYYRKALAINSELKRTESIAVNLNGIGISYFWMEKPDSANVYYRKALAVFRETGNQKRVAVLLNNIANICASNNDSIDKAFVYYREAEKIFNELGSKENEACVIEGLGNAYRRKGLYQEAIGNYQRGLEMLKTIPPDYQLLQLYYSELALTYEALGDYKKALQYERVKTQYADSLLNKERLEQIEIIEKQYETEKKEAEIGRLKAEQELSVARRKQDQYFKILGFVTAFFLFVAFAYTFYLFKQKKKNNEALAMKNRQISKSEEELSLLNAAKNKFFSIIAHDLKSPFHTVMGYSQLLSKEYHQYSDEDREKFAGNIYKSANTIFRLLSNLLDWSRSQTDRLLFNPVSIEFVLIYGNVYNLLKSNADEKKIAVCADFDEGQEVFADPVMLETIVRNLVGNAIKYTYEGGEIVVSIRQSDNEFIISVKDNGVGINPENLEKLFQIDSKVKQKGTHNEDGTGIGLILCKELTDKHRGRIWAENVPEGGSVFYVALPLPLSPDDLPPEL